MSPNQRRFALQAVAAVMALGDSKEGEFPIQPPEHLAEDYNMLALPGTGSSGKGHLSQLRLAAHTSLKHSAAAAPEFHEGLLALLRPGKNQGPKARNKVLAAVNEAQVPLLPYHRPSRHPKAYDPTKPGLTEWRRGGSRDCEDCEPLLPNLVVAAAVLLVGPGWEESGPIPLCLWFWWMLKDVLCENPAYRSTRVICYF